MSNNLQIVQAVYSGLSQRKVARMHGVSRNTVAELVFHAHTRGWYVANDLEGLSEPLFSDGLPQKHGPGRNTLYRLPDYKYVHEELAKPHVTLKLLWEEYVHSCQIEGVPYYMETTFRHRYHQFVGTHRLTLRLEHKPGLSMQVDWAGTKIAYGDLGGGPPLSASLFVAVLPCSKIIYAEPFRDEKMPAWIAGHIHAFEYLRGVPKTLVPDNLRTGVSKASFYEPIINSTYQEMADHYGSVVIPARVRHPQDKAAGENAVLNTSRRIIAALRNHEMASFDDLRKQVAAALEQLNERDLADGSGSRWQSYLREEKDYMLTLPASRYTLTEWRQAKVQVNAHIMVDKHYYSVPFEHIGETVDVRLTDQTIEIFIQNERIYTHKRASQSEKYKTVTDHMPPDKLFYTNWNKSRFLKWASDVGEATRAVVQSIFDRSAVEQHAYRSCFGIMGLAKKHREGQVEMACQYVLTISKQPTYSLIKNHLERATVTERRTGKQDRAAAPKGFVRGAAYFGGDE